MGHKRRKGSQCDKSLKARVGTNVTGPHDAAKIGTRQHQECLDSSNELNAFPANTSGRASIRSVASWDLKT